MVFPVKYICECLKIINYPPKNYKQLKTFSHDLVTGISVLILHNMSKIDQNWKFSKSYTEIYPPYIKLTGLFIIKISYRVKLVVHNALQNTRKY